MRSLQRLVVCSTVIYVILFLFYPDLSHQQTFFYITVLPLSLIYGLINIQQLPFNNKLVLSNILVISYLSLAVLWGSHDSYVDYWKLAKRGLYLSAFFIGCWTVLNHFRHSLQQLLHWLLFLIAISAVISLAHYFYNDGLSLSRMSPVLVSHPIIGAMAYGLGTVCAAYFFCTESARKRQTLYLLALIPTLLVVVLTQSRGPTISVAVALSIMFFTRHTDNFRWALLMLAGLVSAAYAFFATPLGDLFLQRGTSYRVDIWLSVLEELGNNPAFGAGWQRDTSVKTDSHIFAHAHNIYLGTLRHAGIVGFTLLATQMVLHLRAGFRSPNYLMNLMGVCLLFALVNMLFDYNYIITRPQTAWFVLWVPIIFICWYSTTMQQNFPRNPIRQ